MDRAPMPLSLVLEDTGLVVGGERVDTRAAGATRRVCELLGPELQTTIAGVKGSGRTAHWLGSGAVVVSHDAADDALVTLFLCFDETDSSPYPQWVAKVPPFRGSVRWAEHVFSGGEPEDVVASIPGIGGHTGMRHVKVGDLFLLFDLRKPRDRFGKRTGRRRLVQLSAGWGAGKRIAAGEPAVGEPWAD